MNFDQLIRFGVEQGASDVHLQTGASPLLRINGLIRTVESPPVANQDLRQFILSIKKGLTAEQLDRALVEGLDFSYFIPGVSRFRCNIYSHMGTPAMVLRVIKLKIRTLEELKLPSVLRDITLSLRGITLLTGTTGSGKSTTLAAMVDLINNSYRCKIITIEDPVEYMHTNQKAMISQLELGQDTPSFEHGLRQALRQDPDVILVGELRDSETMRMALRAADTGHQVLATVHSTNAAQTIERILAMVPPEERSIATSQLALSLAGGHLAAPGRHARRQRPLRGHGNPPRRGRHRQVHHGKQDRRAERLYRHPRQRHAAFRPALARPLPPESDLRHRGHAAGDQPRGRRAGHARNPLERRRRVVSNRSRGSADRATMATIQDALAIGWKLFQAGDLRARRAGLPQGR